MDDLDREYVDTVWLMLAVLAFVTLFVLTALLSTSSDVQDPSQTVPTVLDVETP